MKTDLLPLLVGGMLTCQAFGASPNLIINGSFEEPDVPTGTFQVFPSGIPGWTIVNGLAPEIQDHVAGSPYEGDQHLELDSISNSGLRQIVPLERGVAYDFSFAYSPRPGVPAHSNGVRVVDDIGAILFTLAEDGTLLNDTSWTVYKTWFVSPFSEIHLYLDAFNTSDSLGGYIDDVRLSKRLPEVGSSLALMGLSLSVIILTHRFMRAS